MSRYENGLNALVQNVQARGINAKYPNRGGLTGCKMDGATDDSAAFQAIVNYANANNLYVYVPEGAMVLNSTINIPAYMTIIGENHQWDTQDAGTAMSKLISNANPAFQPTGYSGSQINTWFNLKDIRIICHPTNDAFLGFAFQRSMHNHIYVYTANTVYNNCHFEYLSEVMHSIFYNTNTSFLNGGITDSNIHHNYINGSVGNNATIGFVLNAPSTSSIDHNYCDFWDQCFQIQTGSDWSVADNIIDACRVGIISNSSMTNGVISGNKFIRCQTASKSYWNTPNANMSNPWMGMAGSYWKNITIANNVGMTTDVLMNFNQTSNFYMVVSYGNVNSSGTVINWLSSNSASGGGGAGIFFNELMYETVTSLPDPRVFINSYVVTSFLNHIVKYNGQLWINDNEQWRLVDGNDSKSSTPTAGTYFKGCRIWNSSPASGQTQGWVCTVSGTMDSISTTCTATGTSVVTVASIGGLKVNQYISINGGAALQIQSINYSNLQVTMSGNVTSGSSLTFVNAPATFIAMSNL